MPMPCYIRARDSGHTLCSPAFPPCCNSLLKACAQPLPQQDALKDCIKEDFHLDLPKGSLGSIILSCTGSTGLEAIPITQVFLCYPSLAIEERTAAVQGVVSEGEKNQYMH